MKIYAPVKTATGVWCSVHFRNGVGETDNPRLIEWFKSHGYKVEESKRVEIAPTEPVFDIGTLDVGYADQPCEDKEPEDMTPNELREWMKANGYGSKIKNIRNKEKLLEIIREG